MTQSELDEILSLHELWLENDSKGNRMMLENKTIENLTIQNRKLGRCHFDKVLFNKCNIVVADLSNCDISQCSFSECHIEKCFIRCCHVSKSSFFGVDLRKSIVIKSIALDTEIRFSNIDDCSFSENVFSNCSMNKINFFRSSLSF